MSIVELKKLTFCGLGREKAEVLAGLQELGLAHLISLNENSTTLQFAQSKLAQRTLKALKYLSQCPDKRHQLSDAEEFDLEKLITRILKVQTNSRQLLDKRDALLKRIKEVEPWGDFNLPENKLGGLKLWFYIVPKRMVKKLHDVGLVWQVVHKDNLHDYVVVVAEQEPNASVMPVARTHTGKLSLSTLKKDLNATELALEDLQAERESLTRWIGLIAANLSKAQDQSELDTAHALSLDKDGVFILQAWAAASGLERIRQFAQHHRLALLCADADVGEVPPTLLSNPARWAGGQDLVSFYQTPGYFGWDPSLTVFFSFAVFFAMIMSDAGYAGIFGFILAIKWRAMGRSDVGTRFRMLALIVIIASLIWGVMTGEYFGYSPQATSLLGKLKIIDMEDFDLMMRVSILVGVVHIALANAINAYQHRYHAKAWSHIGWLAMVIAGFAIGSVSPGLLKQTAYGLLVAGCLLVLLFSSDRRVAKPVDWLWRTLDGFRALTEITSLFGNVLSYLRLFALGMASVSLALTFNQLAVQVYHSVPGAGLLLSLLILLLGHTLNLMLCLLSGVVHGLRLNFIEFYNWSVSDEGYPFKAFAKKGAD